MVLYQYIDGAKIVKYQNRIFAKVLAQNVAPAFLFKDTQNIEESLSSLKYEKNILEAYALDTNGKILGVYVKKQPYKKNQELEKLDLKETQFWKGLQLYTVIPVRAESKSIGYLIIVYSMKEFILHLLVQSFLLH
ncbi:MAG: hypothetical protein FAF04_00130 [Epsilonproteobacteria bacterium]|nr:hypothetical protein [Campylobacterota bacterium]